MVDTGIHHLGWTRQQAIDYMTQNTALSDREIANEVDRYISWPGQALSYELGYLKILELRQKAEQALGAKFDIRHFHDTVLRSARCRCPYWNSASIDSSPRAARSLISAAIVQSQPRRRNPLCSLSPLGLISVGACLV